jgi:Skp family chaperone for outer membrane proteins
MKTAILLFCIALGFAAHATSIAEIDSSVFGHDLLSTVYLQIQTGDSVDQVLELLQTVEDEINQEQHDHDERHSAFQTSCEEDRAYYTAEIERAAGQIEENTANLQAAYPERSRLEGEIQQHQDGLSEAEGALAFATAVIEGQREEFKIHSAELLDSLTVFGEARNILSQAFGTAGSFLQTGSGSSFAAHLNGAKLVAKYQPFAKILAQAAVSEKLSQDALEHIFNLIDRLVSNAQDTLRVERETQQNREDAYATYASELSDIIAGHKEALGFLGAELSTLNDNIAFWESSLEDAQFRFETFSQKLVDRNANCEQEATQYDDQTRQRNADIAVIDQVQDLIGNRVDTFVEYITSTRDNVQIS